MSERIWSPMQQGIFSWFKTGTGNLVVRARAGTGKSTTILEGINHAPEENILLCAFNKRIADELTTKLRNPRAESKTLHSVGFGLVRKQWKVQVNEDRGRWLARKAWEETGRGSAENAPDAPISWIAKLAGVAKSIGQLLEQEHLVELALTFNIVPEGEWQKDLTVEDLAEMAVEACVFAAERDGYIDYDDMVWLPVIHGWGRPVYDLVVVDEAQDMNGSQLALAQSVASGRIVVVGDERQAIYAFRGADSNALDRLKKELKAQELPLTVTYRCPKKVVKEAQALCPDFTAHESAPEGTVKVATEEEMIQEIEPNDFLLSRLNAPLASLWLQLLRAGKPARVEGRDLAKGLIAFVRQPKVQDVGELLAVLEQTVQREVLKLNQSKRKSAETRVAFLQDRLEMVSAMSEGLVTVQELVSRIEEMFGMKGVPRACVILSTVHKAKGLEANRVYILTDTLYCRGKRRESTEEAAIHYVALTRSKDTLVLVTSPKKENGGVPA